MKMIRIRIILCACLTMLVLLACSFFDITPPPPSGVKTRTPVPTRTLLIHPLQTLTPIPGLGLSDTWVRPKDGMRMMFVPGGEFSMGMEVDQSMQVCGEYCPPAWFEDEIPVHMVKLNAYWIDQTEVTNDMYTLCVTVGACSPPNKFAVIEPAFFYYDGEHGDNPVVYIPWSDAEAYCAWAEARLPTEAEWELAARGVEGRIFPWGDTLPNEDLQGFNGPYHPVGSFPAGVSPYGALDMAGGVMEWVADWYSPDYYSQSQLENPTGPTSGTLRVVRGENSDYHINSAAVRGSNDPQRTDESIGFRCARDAFAP